MNLPPDRSHIATEQRNLSSAELDRLSIAECIRVIQEQDATVPQAVARAAPSIEAFIRATLERFNSTPSGSGRLIYLGAGTSGRLGVLDASECPPTFQTPHGMVVGIIAGGDPALRISSEGKEDLLHGAKLDLDQLGIGPHDSILGIAAGGTTPYVHGALQYAASLGSLTGLLTCTPISTPAFVNHHIMVDTGPEVVTGSTRMKAGTATKLVLNTISTTLMVQLGKVYGNLMVDLRATNDKLRDRAARIITQLTGLPRAEAFKLLDRAGGSTKHAVVMHARACTLEEADRLLQQFRGNLRLALER